MELASSSMPSPIVPLKKGSWSEAEDLLLATYIEKYGPRNWAQVPTGAGLNRCRKSCRLRWLNYLQPNIKRGEFEPDELDLIIRMHELLGNRWTLIAGRVPGRTANDIKNYYNTYLLKKKSRRLLPRPNLGTVENNRMMMTTKVFRPVPRKISEKSLVIRNKPSIPTWTNINNNLTTTKFLESTTDKRVTSNINNEEITKKSLKIAVANHANKFTSENDTQITNNNSSAVLDFENTTSFHVAEGLKLLGKSGSSDGNFDADQEVEECVKIGDNGNCWFDDLYLGDDLWSIAGPYVCPGKKTEGGTC